MTSRSALTQTTPARSSTTGALAIVLILVLIVGVARLERHRAQAHPVAATVAAPLGRPAARQSAERFLARFEAGDGRVVRWDQGGDSVSEGQAYAMLVSAGIGDAGAFRRAWAWTQAHLQLPGGLLAWHWQDGRIIGGEPAADADLDAAHALLLGAVRFGAPGYRADAVRIADAILRHETFSTPAGPVLAAGPWALSRRRIDPSYLSPASFTALAAATGDPRWTRLANTARRLLAELTDVHGAPRLPPDWATVSPAGHATASASPGQPGPRFSYDALRVPVRLMGTGTPGDRLRAALLWPFFSGADAGRSVISVTGTPLTAAVNPAMLAAQAAVAVAAGQPGAATRRLAQAERMEASRPTYYGAAILALTQLTLSGAIGF